MEFAIDTPDFDVLIAAMSSIDTFISFTDTCHPDQLQWFADVTIDDSITHSRNPALYVDMQIFEIWDLMEFYKAYPNMKVELILGD